MKLSKVNMPTLVNQDESPQTRRSYRVPLIGVLLPRKAIYKQAAMLALQINAIMVANNSKLLHYTGPKNKRWTYWLSLLKKRNNNTLIGVMFYI